MASFSMCRSVRPEAFSGIRHARMQEARRKDPPPAGFFDSRACDSAPMTGGLRPTSAGG